MEISFGSIESVKMVADVFMPVSGVITSINEDLNEQPQLSNSDPFMNWMLQISPDLSEEIGTLLSIQ